MKFVYALVAAIAIVLGVRWWMGQHGAPTPAVAVASAASLTPSSEGPTLGEATVLTSHTYKLLAPTSSRIKRSYIELGQRVKK